MFDLVFAEGVEAIFRFAIALIKRNEDVLLKLEFEDLIEFLKNGLFEVYAVGHACPCRSSMLARLTKYVFGNLSRRERRRNKIRNHSIE